MKKISIDHICILFTAFVLLAMLSCAQGGTKVNMNEPLVKEMFIADPSVHVFDDRLFIYPSHDLEKNKSYVGDGDQYDMEDYHVFSMKNFSSVIDHGEVLNVKNVPWAEKQMWAPDAATKNGKFYLYFPAKDKSGVFRIGVAVSDKPEGPFTPEAQPIPGSFSIDPAVFVDDDGKAYIFFGGLWGGQLEKWQTDSYEATAQGPSGATQALGPRIAMLKDNMLEFAAPATKISILDGSNKPLAASDNTKRFFEGPWVHKYRGTYYLSYSTGDTHYLVYATSQNILGPYVYRGRILDPVFGWTTHHSIVEYKNKWYLFYHDASLSGGRDHLRSVKYTELFYNPDGTIQKVDPKK